FGARLDDEAAQFEKNASSWDAAHWRSWLSNDTKAWLLAGVTDDGREQIQTTAAWEGDKPGTTEWALGWLKLPIAECVPPDLIEPEAKFINDRRRKLEKLLEAIRQMQLGTNVGESLRTLLNREANGMIQGVIL